MQLTMGEDPTIMAFETGNEVGGSTEHVKAITAPILTLCAQLGGYGGSNYPPTVEWTTAIATHIKSLAPNTLIIDGTYGVRKENLAITGIDI